MECFYPIFREHSLHFFFSPPHNAVHSAGPRAHYSTDLLARLLGTVSRILWRLCAPAVIRHASAKENISCLVWLSARDVPCGLTEGPHAATMEEQSQSCSAVETNALTFLTRRMWHRKYDYLPSLFYYI